MTEPVAWMDGQGNLYRYPDDADRGQTMRPLFFAQSTHPNLEPGWKRGWFDLNDEEINAASKGHMNSPERIFHTDEKEFFELRKRMYERLNPPKREWVGLTDAEVDEIYEQVETLVHDSWVGTVGLMFPITLYKAIEGKLKEKNT